MNKFARLIEHPDVGQVLITKEVDDEPGFAPIIRITFDPNAEDLAPSSIALKFPDSDQGLQQRDTAFDEIEESRVIDMVRKSIADIQKAFA
jgi:hypothetical protein